MCKKEINVLYEMLEQIPDHLVFNFGLDEWTSVKVLKGSADIKGVMKIKEIAIIDSYLSPDTEVEVHYHEEKEIFIIYEGTIDVIIGDTTQTYNTGETVEISPNIPHFVRTEKGCRLIAITIPANKYWPDVRD